MERPGRLDSGGTGEADKLGRWTVRNISIRMRQYLICESVSPTISGCNVTDQQIITGEPLISVQEYGVGNVLEIVVSPFSGKICVHTVMIIIIIYIYIYMYKEF